MDDIREKLRKSGYLTVENYLAGNVQSSSSLFRNIFKVSLKLGLLCGMLIGILTGLLPPLLNRGEVHSIRDTLILSGYLTAVFSLLSLFAVLFIALVTNFLFRHCKKRNIDTGNFPKYIAIAVSIFFGFYYFFWVRSVVFHHESGFADYSLKLFLPDISFLFLVLLIGRLFAAAARIFISTISAKGNQQNRGIKGIVPVLGMVMGFIILFAIVMVSEGNHINFQSDYSKTEITENISDNNMKVFVLGIDGVSRKMLFSLINQGHLPNISSLLKEGGYAVFKSPPSLEAPGIWTTLGTGIASSRHGVNDFEQTKIRGIQGDLAYNKGEMGFYRILHAVLPHFRMTEEEPVSGNSLNFKPVWEILGDFGKRVGVVNWWATWPAASTNGVIISDRAFIGHYTGERSERDIFPHSLHQELKRYLADPKEIRKKIFSGDQEKFKALTQRLKENLTYILAGDYFTLQATVGLLKQKNFDFIASYFPGVDLIKRGYFKKEADPVFDDFLEINEFINHYMAFMDDSIGKICGILKTEENHLVILVFEPGIEGAGTRHSERSEGLMIFSGKEIEADTTTRASITDLTPTILAVQGFPLSGEFKGRILKEVFKDSFKERMVDNIISTYGRRSVPMTKKISGKIKNQVMEKFKSLGYIQ